MKNLQFGMAIEADNLKIQEKLTWAKNQNQSGLSPFQHVREYKLTEASNKVTDFDFFVRNY